MIYVGTKITFGSLFGCRGVFLSKTKKMRFWSLCLILKHQKIVHFVVLNLHLLQYELFRVNNYRNQNKMITKKQPETTFGYLGTKHKNSYFLDKTLISHSFFLHF